VRFGKSRHFFDRRGFHHTQGKKKRGALPAPDAAHAHHRLDLTPVKPRTHRAGHACGHPSPLAPGLRPQLIRRPVARVHFEGAGLIGRARLGSDAKRR